MFIIEPSMVVLLTFCVCPPIESFILDGPDCFISPPCSCSRNNISCDNRGLLDLPELYPVPVSSLAADIVLHFSGNKLTNVSDDAFQNVTSSQAVTIHLDLSNNMISSISDSAFVGIENQTSDLNLQTNLLTSLPPSLRSLVNLETLELAGNPLVNLDVQVLVGFQNHLQALGFSAGNMASWPGELLVLRSLTTLKVDHVPFSSLPYDAFHGFESTLRGLRLSYTNLERIPDNICRLKNLHSFAFSYNSNFNENIPHQYLCHEPLNGMFSLTLEGNNISKFPGEVFTSFPHLLHLYLANNTLRYIPSESVPQGNIVTILDLSNNLFSSVPYAISSFRKMHSLDLSSNQIYAIEHDDFVGLVRLGLLFLQSNPIEYIDHAAFTGPRYMTYLDMSNSRLDTIPSAVLSINKLSTLEFNVTPHVECSCDKLGGLRSWNVTGVTIDGSCEFSGEQIKDYLVSSLPTCPA